MMSFFLFLAFFHAFLQEYGWQVSIPHNNISFCVFVTVLKCLQARYSARVFYTHAGCTLVALNPFQPIPHLYSLDVMHEYHSASQPQVNIQSVHMYRMYQLMYCI